MVCTPVLAGTEIFHSLDLRYDIDHFTPNTSFHQFGAYHCTFGFAKSFLLLFGQMSFGILGV